MRAIKFCALVGVVALVAVACQSAPEDAVNAPANEAVAGNATAAAEQPESREPQQPEAPRAEGDRLAELLASDDFLLLDVRRPDEIERLGTVEGYLNIPIEELADRLEEVPRDRPILTA